EETTGIARTQTARTQTPRRRMMQPPGSHRGWVYKRARNPTPETHPPQYERPQETTQENRPKRNGLKTGKSLAARAARTCARPATGAGDFAGRGPRQVPLPSPGEAYSYAPVRRRPDLRAQRP